MGFLLTPDEARALIAEDARNSDVLLPYLNGEEVNSSPVHAPERWVINFADWPEGRARTYPSCFAIIEEKVRAERQVLASRTASGRDYAKRWWQFGRPTRQLYDAISGHNRALVLSIVSKYVSPTFVPPAQVFSHRLVVFSYDDDFHFGLLASAIHNIWAVKYSSTLETRLNYAPTDCFETFPQPPYSPAVEAAGKALDDHRRPLMIANNEGLTKTYNRVHNPAEQSAGIVRLRELHRELDHAVRDAYGWQDLDLDHGFHETSQGVRYTIGPAARTEVLDRLLELNHQRYAEEVAAGLHDKKKGAKGKARANAATQEARRLL